MRPALALSGRYDANAELRESNDRCSRSWRRLALFAAVGGMVVFLLATAANVVLDQSSVLAGFEAVLLKALTGLTGQLPAFHPRRLV